MKQLPKVSRRSFLATVAGATGHMVFSGSSRAETFQGCTDSDPAPPRGDAGGQGRNCTNRPRTACSDADAGPNGDPGGAGRTCRPQEPVSGCSDSDPSDPIGRGRNCSGASSGARSAENQVTSRRERTYEVCWVDSPTRRDDQCNLQIYTEWQTTYADGRIMFETAEADARKAEMERRGYTARSHRMLQDW